MRTLLAAVVILVAPVSSWAALGRPLSSVAADHKRLGGELRSTSAGAFSVHEITASDGNIVREYASPAGEVFGVAWQGATMPNLQLLLGDSFTAFQQAAHATHQRGGPLLVRTEHLVVESGGHMRDFHGRAWLPDHLPATVTEAAVK